MIVRMAKQEDIVGVTEAAAILGVGGRQVRNLIADGLLPAVQLGREWAIRRADLANVPRERKPGPKPKKRGGK
jgi:excisionase family DNA binding protein